MLSLTSTELVDIVKGGSSDLCDMVSIECSSIGVFIYSGSQNRPDVLLFWIDWLGVKR